MIRPNSPCERSNILTFSLLLVFASCLGITGTCGASGWQSSSGPLNFEECSNGAVEASSAPFIFSTDFLIETKLGSAVDRPPVHNFYDQRVSYEEALQTSRSSRGPPVT